MTMSLPGAIILKGDLCNLTGLGKQRPKLVQVFFQSNWNPLIVTQLNVNPNQFRNRRTVISQMKSTQQRSNLASRLQRPTLLERVDRFVNPIHVDLINHRFLSE